MDNFGFLKTKWPDLAEVGHLAETLLGVDPKATLSKLRLFAELVTGQIMQEAGILQSSVWEDHRFLRELTTLRKYRAAPDFILNYLHTLRIEGNKANHRNYGNYYLAAAMLRKAFALGIWLMKTYGPPGFVPPEFSWDYGREEAGEEEKGSVLLLNIFAPLDKVNDEELRSLVAILQNITLANYLKETGSKIGSFLTKKLNQAGALIGHGDWVPEVEIKKVSDLIDEATQNLQGYRREELISLFQAELAKRVNLNGEISPEALSVTIINEAAKGLRLDSGLSLAQKAQLVYERYKERLWEEAQKWAKRFSGEEKEKAAARLDEALSGLKEEERRALEKSLGVDRLTGTVIMKALTGAAGPLSLIALVELTGFGAYLMLTTVLHAVFTTMLGITLPFSIYTGAASLLSFLTGPVGWLLAVGFGGFQLQKGTLEINRNLLAMVIWFSLSHYQGQVAPWDEDLPSWAEGEERAKVEGVDRRLNKLEAERADLTANLKTAAGRLDKAEALRTRLTEEKQKTTNQQEILAKELRQLEEAWANGTWRKQQITPGYQAKAKVWVEKLTRKVPTLSPLEKLFPGEEEQYQNVLRKKREEVERLDQKLAELEKKLAATAQELKQAADEKTTLQRAVEETGQQVEACLLPRAQEIQNLWELHFRRLFFAEPALRQVAALPLARRLVLERYLLELNELNNPVLLAEGKTTVDGRNCHYLFITLAKGEKIRLVYLAQPDGTTKILQISAS